MWSFLRWSSTGGIGVCILAVARMGIACVSLRRTSTDHSLPYFNSGLPQKMCKSARVIRLQCMEVILTFKEYMTGGVMDINSLLRNPSVENYSIPMLGLRLPYNIN